MNRTDGLGSQRAQGLGIITDLDSEHRAMCVFESVGGGISEKLAPSAKRLPCRHEKPSADSDHLGKRVWCCVPIIQ